MILVVVFNLLFLAHSPIEYGALPPYVLWGHNLDKRIRPEWEKKNIKMKVYHYVLKI